MLFALTVSFAILFASMFAAFWAVKVRPLEARLAQIEKQQAVDSNAFAAQARLHGRLLRDHDVRMQFMAREIRATVPVQSGTSSDDRITALDPLPAQFP